MPTTSHPPSRRGRKVSKPQDAPLRSLRLTFTLPGTGAADLGRLAAEKGLAVEEGRGRKNSLVLTAATPEEALAQLGVISGLLASKS